jgi:hypothetical protein
MAGKGVSFVFEDAEDVEIVFSGKVLRLDPSGHFHDATASDDLDPFEKGRSSMREVDPFEKGRTIIGEVDPFGGDPFDKNRPSLREIDPFEKVRPSRQLPDGVVATLPLMGDMTAKMMKTVIDTMARNGVHVGNVVINNAGRIDADTARAILDSNAHHDSDFTIYFSNRKTFL